MSSDSVLDEVMTLERRGWDSLCDGTGADFYGGVMTGDAVMVLANGAVLDRPTVIASLRDAPAWSSYEIGDEQLITAAAGCAILVYTGTARREDTEFVGRMSSVYVQTDGGWRLALYQQTVVTG